MGKVRNFHLRLTMDNTKDLTNECVEEPLSVLKPFFNCCYYLLLIPFRLDWDAKNGRFIISTHLLQKIICACFHSFTWAYGTLILYFLYKDFGRNPAIDSTFVSTVFRVISRTAIAVFVLQFVKSSWCGRSAFLEMINVVKVTSLSRKKSRLLSRLMFIFGMTCFLVVPFYGYFVVNHWILAANNQTTAENTSSRNIFGAPFYLIWSNCLMQRPPFYYLLIVCQVHSLTLVFLCHMYMSVLSGGLLAMAWDFKRILAREGGNIQNGLRIYRELQANLNVVNKVWSDKLLTFSILLISYYGGIPDVLMGHIDEEPVASTIVYFVFNTFGWLLAAKFHSMVNKTFLEWVDKQVFDTPPVWQILVEGKQRALLPAVEVASSFDNQLKLISMKNDVQYQPVAMSCSFFNVTNSFLCSMLGLVVTYGIIIFQTRSPSP